MRQHFLYVAAFERGLIKVGRSVNPHKRIGQHEDRLSCAGILLLDRHIVECAGNGVAAESALIERCAEVATVRRQREWFEGLLFSTACGWADEAGAMKVELVVSQSGSKSPILDFIRERLAGRSQAEWKAIADEAGIPYATLEKIAYGVTKDPRVGTVEPLHRILKSRADAPGIPAEKVA